jgi:hypothetical protein
MGVSRGTAGAEFAMAMIGSHKSSRAAIANAVDKIEAAQRLLAEGVRELAAALALDARCRRAAH